MSRQWCRWRQRRPPLLRCWCSMRAARGHRCSLDERTAVNRQAGHTYIHLHEERTAGRIAQPTSSFAWPWVLRLVDRARLPLQDNERAQRAVARRKGCSIVSSRTSVYKFRAACAARPSARSGRARGRLSRPFLLMGTWSTGSITYILYMNRAGRSLCPRPICFKTAIRARRRPGSERWVGASAHGGGGGRCCARGQ